MVVSILYWKVEVLYRNFHEVEERKFEKKEGVEAPRGTFRRKINANAKERNTERYSWRKDFKCKFNVSICSYFFGQEFSDEERL